MAKIITDKKKINELLSRSVSEVLVREHLEKKLLSGKKLRVKFGIDPTGSVLHLGHAIPLRKLKEFQELGHQVILLIGDFTARIGDPTGKSATRKPMTDKEVRQNMKTYTKQAGLILDMKKVEIRYNSEWLGKMKFEELVQLASKVTFAQVSQRADFKERIKNDQDLSLQEFLYPIMQGYDSVVLEADVEIGGTDQKFNLLMGRQLQKRYDKTEQDILTCTILEGLSGGDKMSKSLNNFIALNENAENMYGQVMSLVDDLIIEYFELCTDVASEEIETMKIAFKEGRMNPRDLKMRLAFEIVKNYHDERKARGAEKHFVKTVQKKEVAEEDIVNYELQITNYKLVDLLVEVKLASSKGEARRLIEQGGIKVDGEVAKDFNKEIVLTENGILIQRGKRQFVRVTKKIRNS